ncbi:MAG: PH domain-containing protein [Vicinamibacterales bacterium]
MPSERRLHPLSIFFNLGKQATGLLVPLLLLLAGSRSEGLGWELLGAVFLVPYAGAAFGRYLTFRYRYEPAELVIRSGLLFRNERHVPYARIQNIEAVQNVAHRLFGVAEVRIQTGGADEPEATMTVLRLDALGEMRSRVFEGQEAVRDDRQPVRAGAQTGAEPADEVVLQLPIREVMLSGFIENRGLLVVAAALGLLSQLDIMPGAIERLVREQFARRQWDDTFMALRWSGAPLVWVGIALGAVTAFLLLTRILSMGWALVRMHGFTATRSGDEVRVEFGLLTRMTTTIPLKRIQQLTIRETPLHRLTGRASVRVTTAGGAGEGERARQREWLAPIIRRVDLPRFLASVLPGVTLDDFEWRRVHPRAFRRAVKKSAFFWTAAGAAAAGIIGWRALALLPLFLLASVLQARLHVSNLGWARSAGAVGFRRGAFWNYVTIARYSKIQAVSLRESPFDRRTGMARLVVDIAGAGETYLISIPYLGRETARTVMSDLAARAGRTELTW